MFAPRRSRARAAPRETTARIVANRERHELERQCLSPSAAAPRRRLANSNTYATLSALPARPGLTPAYGPPRRRQLPVYHPHYEFNNAAWPLGTSLFARPVEKKCHDYPATDIRAKTSILCIVSGMAPLSQRMEKQVSPRRRLRLYRADRVQEVDHFGHVVRSLGVLHVLCVEVRKEVVLT